MLRKNQKLLLHCHFVICHFVIFNFRKMRKISIGVYIIKYIFYYIYSYRGFCFQISKMTR